jgi:signal transduction histidine kinase
MVSHELRTPLTSINGFLSLLLGGAGGAPSATQKEYMEIMRNNTGRLLSQINDLLDVSKMESGAFTIDRKPCDIAVVIKQCIADIEALLKNRNITVNLAMPDAPFILNIDAYRISQSVTNLLSNSIKFSPPGSAIDIRSEASDLASIKTPGRAGAGSLKPGQYAMISVQDHGRGIDSGNIEKIFERFYQVGGSNTKKNPGTGLGLNIVKNIVQAHGGTVWAESGGIDKGTKFIILLPV